MVVDDSEGIVGKIYEDQSPGSVADPEIDPIIQSYHRHRII